MHDLIIIGGSAAATSAGIYAARRELDFKIIAKEFGGEVATSGEIGNWPGINQTDGLKLAQQFKNHLEYYKVSMEEGIEVEKISRQENGVFCIYAKTDGPRMASEKLEDEVDEKTNCVFLAKTVIVATGVHPKELDIKGEKEFRGKGVSYCSVCDMPVFQGRTVATIGGGNSALESGLMAADIARQGYVINKNAEFKGEQILIDKLSGKKNIEIIFNASTIEIFGDKFVSGLRYIDSKGDAKELKADGIFIHIGMVPNSWFMPQEAAKNKFGEIIVDKNCATNIPGLFAAGDVTDVPFKQIVVAAGQGTIAALSAIRYLNNQA